MKNKFVTYFTDTIDLIKDPYKEMVEGYDLDSGQTIYVSVEFIFDTVKGLVPKQFIFLNKDMKPLNIPLWFLHYEDFIWLTESLKKDVKKFQDAMYETAETDYINSRKEYRRSDRLEET